MVSSHSTQITKLAVVKITETVALSLHAHLVKGPETAEHQTTEFTWDKEFFVWFASRWFLIA